MTDIDRSSRPRPYVSFHGHTRGREPFEDAAKEHAEDVRAGACDMERWRCEDERDVRRVIAWWLTCRESK